MSDLISRSDVVNLLCILHIDNVTVNGKRVTEYIRELPTAYDIEKVVAELEEELKNAQMEYTLGKYNLDNGIGENYRQDMNEGRCFAYDSAINIVRKGGVND